MTSGSSFVVFLEWFAANFYVVFVSLCHSGAIQSWKHQALVHLARSIIIMLPLHHGNFELSYDFGVLFCFRIVLGCSKQGTQLHQWVVLCSSVRPFDRTVYICASIHIHMPTFVRTVPVFSELITCLRTLLGWVLTQIVSTSLGNLETLHKLKSMLVQFFMLMESAWAHFAKI